MKSEKSTTPATLIRLAGSEDEAQLRELLRGGAMPGWIRLAFGREPDFFHGAAVQGRACQVLAALREGRVTAMGCRAVKPLFVNGHATEMGYLGGLRLAPEVRRTGLLARGYAAFKRLHQAAPVPAYLTTIIEENTAARAILTSGRAGLPHYLDQGRHITYAINLCARRRPCPATLEIRRGDEVGLEPILRFLAEQGPRRQFFPALAAADFSPAHLRGLGPADFRVAVHPRGELLGVAAVWDQNAFRQHLVAGYAAPVRLGRPLLNLALQLGGFRPLPAPGRGLAALYVAFACVRGDDPGLLRALLEQIYAAHRHGPHHFLLLGLHERDPLRAALSHFLTFRYVSRFYIVCWDDGLDFVRRLDPSRVPYLELATL